MHRILILPILIICSLPADFVGRLLAWIKVNPSVPALTRQIAQQAESFPVAAVVMGITYGIGCSIVLSPRISLGAGEILGVALIFSVFQWVLQIGLGFLGPIFALVGLPPVFGFIFLLTVMFASITRGVYQLEFPSWGIPVAGILACGILALNFVGGFPFNTGRFVYTVIGGSLAVMVTAYPPKNI